MTNQADVNSHLRRQQDFPILVVSQDYELFFGRSGSIEKCLIEPCEMLLDFADMAGVKVTFFVDAGMLCCMGELARTDERIEKNLSRSTGDIASTATPTIRAWPTAWTWWPAVLVGARVS